MPTIRLKNVTKVLKGRPRDFHDLRDLEEIRPRQTVALQDVDLEIEQGEFLFLLGSRGAGKSTLLNVISGDLTPDRGVVYYNDVNLRKLGRRQRARLRERVGKVSQESGLTRTITVLRNLTAEKKALKDIDIDRPLIEKALGLVGMRDSLNRYPLELSIAECRRVELAKAILRSPDILLLDGITNRMDDDSIWDMMHLLDELNRRGTTVVMSTSAKKFVNIMRKRVITLSDGRIVGDVRRGRYGDIV